MTRALTTPNTATETNDHAYFYVSLVRRFIPLVISLVVLFILYWLIDTSGLILLPLFIGYLYALAFEPLVHDPKTRHKKLTAGGLMLVCFLLELAVLAIIPYLIVDGIALLKNIFPSINTLARWFVKRLGEYDITIQAKQLNAILPQISEYFSNHGQEIFVNITLILQALIYILLAPIFGFYLLMNWHSMGKKFSRLIPRPYRKKSMHHVNYITNIFASFLRGQLIVSLILLAYYSILFFIIGLKNGLIIGFITGVISFVPFLGFITAVALATITALTEWQNGIQILLAVWAIFAFGHLVENIYLVPKFIGKSVGLKPVVAIISILLIGNWFGLFGVIFAIPIASIMIYLFGLYLLYYKKSNLYKNGLKL